MGDKHFLKGVIIMMNFVILVAAFVTANLLVATIAMMVFTNKKVLKWYYKKIFSLMNSMNEMVEELEEEP